MNNVFEEFDFMNYIDDTVEINFEVPEGVKKLMKECEEADITDNYPLYRNLAEYLVYVLCKELYVTGHITKEQWKKIEWRYPQ